MKTIQIIILFFISYLIIISSCASKNDIVIQNKLRGMSDSELIEYYQIIEMSIAEIDRKNGQMIEEERMDFAPTDAQNLNGRLYGYYQGSLNLRNKQKLILLEMKDRGISTPPKNGNH